jgi:hypothetical protein
MSKLPDNMADKPKGLSVEQLLRFKKAECPDSAFWDDFDRQLHQRLFQTVVERRESRLRTWFSTFVHSRSTYAMSALAALIVMIGLTISRSSSVVSPPSVGTVVATDMVVSVEAPQRAAKIGGRESFVDDKLNMNMENGSFRKVMATQAMKVSAVSTSTRYVADQVGVGSSHGGVLFASDSF